MSMRLGQVSISVSALLVAWISGTTALRAATPSPFEFEQVSPWSAANGASLAVSDLRTQGQASLSVRARGYTAISTPAFAFSQPITSSLVTFDLRLPATQPNPFWLGQTQMLVSCPSGGINNAFVGQTELTGRALEVFQSISITLPAAVATVLGRGCPDLSVTVVLNVPSDASGAYLLDNMRLGQAIPPAPTGSSYAHYSVSVDTFGNVTEEWSTQQFQTVAGQAKLALVKTESKTAGVDGSVTTTQPYTINYSYDAAGRLTAASSATVTTTTTDAFGSVTRTSATQTFAVVAGQAKLSAVTTTSATATGVDGSVTTTQPYTISYSYDGGGRLTAASSATVSTTTTDVFGNVTRTTATQTFAVVAGQAKLSAATTTSSTTSAVDGSVTTTQPYTINYSYDAAARLTAASSATVSTTTTDAFGNLTRATATQTFGVVAGQAKLSALTTSSTTTGVDGSASVTQPYTVNYTYDAAARLTAASSVTITTITTDAFGNVTTSIVRVTFVIVNGQAKPA